MLVISKRVLFLILLTTFFMSMTANPVYACSFGGDPPTIENEFANGVIAVIGEVVETDYHGQNLLVHVESYVTGGLDSEYILIVRNRPARVEAVLGEHVVEGCDSVLPEINVGESGLWLLGRSPSGYYFIDNRAMDSSQPIIMNNPENTISFYIDCADCDGGREIEEATFDEFIALLGEISGEAPGIPMSNSFMPARQQLVVRTSTGTDYLLPIDGSPNVLELDLENLNAWMSISFGGMLRNYVDGSSDRFALVEGETCTNLDCITFSPDGTQFAFTSRDNILRLPYGYELPGDRASFSPDGDLIAVWNDNSLIVYDLNYRQFLQEAYGNLDDSRQITALLEVTLDDVTRDADVIWSANSRLLAYSNSDGLWLWDTWFPDTEARLLVPVNATGEISLAQYFSPIDQFLTIVQADSVQTIDIATGSGMFGGLVSPSQTLLLTSGRYPISLLGVRDAIETGGSAGNYDIPEMVWLDETHYAWMSIFPLSDSADWCTYHSQTINTAISREFEDYEGIPCTANLLTRDYWVIANEATVMINGHMIDLTGLIDGDIVSLRWLPSLFYSRN